MLGPIKRGVTRLGEAGEGERHLRDGPHQSLSPRQARGWSVRIDRGKDQDQSGDVLLRSRSSVRISSSATSTPSRVRLGL
jgi:hypothetical protein